jgi:hypothetical protein
VCSAELQLEDEELDEDWELELKQLLLLDEDEEDTHDDEDELLELLALLEDSELKLEEADDSDVDKEEELD